jgi:hypothetical protein
MEFYMVLRTHNYADALADRPLYAKLYAAFSKAVKPQMNQHPDFQPIDGSKLKADLITAGIALIEAAAKAEPLPDGDESLLDREELIDAGAAMIAGRNENVVRQDEFIAEVVESVSQEYASDLVSGWLSALRIDKESAGYVRAGAVLPDVDPAFNEYWADLTDSLATKHSGIDMKSVLRTGLEEIANQEPGDIELPLKLTLDRTMWTTVLSASIKP